MDRTCRRGGWCEGFWDEYGDAIDVDHVNGEQRCMAPMHGPMLQFPVNESRKLTNRITLIQIPSEQNLRRERLASGICLGVQGDQTWNATMCTPDAHLKILATGQLSQACPLTKSPALNCYPCMLAVSQSHSLVPQRHPTLSELEFIIRKIPLLHIQRHAVPL